MSAGQPQMVSGGLLNPGKSQSTEGIFISTSRIQISCTGLVCITVCVCVCVCVPLQDSSPSGPATFPSHIFYW